MGKLSESKNLKLQLQPTLADGELSIHVAWQGKPLANQQVNLRSPTVSRNYKTNAEGIAIIPLDRAGLHYLRTKVVVKESGEFNGKAFAEVHHHSTLVMKISDSK